MKVLLLYPHINQKSLMNNYVGRLREHGLNIDLICTMDPHTDIMYTSQPLLLILLKKLQSLHTRFTSGMLNRIIRAMLWVIVIPRIAKKYDLVDFHSYIHSCDYIIDFCLAHKIPYDITLWGSDIMRADESRVKKMANGFKNCRYIKCLENLSLEVHRKYNGEFDSKVRIQQFGNTFLDIIDSVSEERPQICQRLYGIQDNKVVITCGYNASMFQRHQIIIDSLKALPQHIKSRIHVVLPMTYPDNAECSEYREVIREYINSSGLGFTIFDKFMPEKDVAALRISTDIMVNIQDTDAFSGSIQDHLYCGNVCIIGDWLNYTQYRDTNVYYIKCNKERLRGCIQDVIEKIDEYRDRCLDNKDKIRTLSSWDAVIDNLYNNYL